MRKEPMMAYTCSCCGRQFIDYLDCERHEKICREWQDREVCPDCHGQGEVKCGYESGRYIGFDFYERVPSYMTCYTCNGRGWVYKKDYRY